MKKPLIDQLPKLNSSFHEIKPFLFEFDSVSYFKETWKADYYKNAENNWERNINLYRNNDNPYGTWQELILVMTFDYYLGPYVGLPEKIKIDFYRWLINDIREKITHS